MNSFRYVIVALFLWGLIVWHLGNQSLSKTTPSEKGNTIAHDYRDTGRASLKDVKIPFHHRYSGEHESDSSDEHEQESPSTSPPIDERTEARLLDLAERPSRVYNSREDFYSMHHCIGESFQGTGGVIDLRTCLFRNVCFDVDDEAWIYYYNNAWYDELEQGDLDTSLVTGWRHEWETEDLRRIMHIVHTPLSVVDDVEVEYMSGLHVVLADFFSTNIGHILGDVFFPAWLALNHFVETVPLDTQVWLDHDSDMPIYGTCAWLARAKRSFREKCTALIPRTSPLFSSRPVRVLQDRRSDVLGARRVHWHEFDNNAEQRTPTQEQEQKYVRSHYGYPPGTNINSSGRKPRVLSDDREGTRRLRCFDRVVLGAHNMSDHCADVTDHGRNGGITWCNHGKAPLYRSFRSHILRSLGVQNRATTNLQGRILFALNTSRFSVLNADEWQEVHTRLREHVRRTCEECADELNIDVRVDLATYSMKKQVDVMSAASMYVGPCGGGSFFLTFLPPGSQALLLCDRFFLDFHLFKFLTHVTVDYIENPQNTNAVLDSITKMVVRNTQI